MNKQMTVLINYIYYTITCIKKVPSAGLITMNYAYKGENC